MPTFVALRSRFTPPAGTAMLSFALGGEGAPNTNTNAQIFPDGLFCSDDNRPATLTKGALTHWRMDAAVAQTLIDQMAALKAAGKRGILFDYEHNSCYGDSRSAGWIETLLYQEGKGLFAKVAWSPAAQKEISEDVYCYLSPYFRFDSKTGAITELISVALTNVPALSALDAVDLTLNPSHPSLSGDHDIPLSEQEVAALTNERDGLKANLAALTAERESLKTQSAALTTERDALLTQVKAFEAKEAEAALTAEKAKHGELLAAALTDGRLTPAQKPWAEKQSAAALTEYLEATKPLPLTQTQSTHEAGTAALTAEEIAMCDRMGVSHEDFKKAKTP